MLESTNRQFKVVHNIGQGVGLVNRITERLGFGDFIPQCIFFALSSLEQSWELH